MRSSIGAQSSMLPLIKKRKYRGRTTVEYKRTIELENLRDEIRRFLRELRGLKDLEKESCGIRKDSLLKQALFDKVSTPGFSDDWRLKDPNWQNAVRGLNNQRSISFVSERFSAALPSTTIAQVSGSAAESVEDAGSRRSGRSLAEITKRIPARRRYCAYH